MSLEYDDKLQSNTFLSIVANDGKFSGITKTQGETKRNVNKWW